ncbi:HAD-IIIC family phosphatase (plasmid) [Azospirillum melinis]|uniref:HAD-IIIC family phosphatase n=1 Tax=Azospirillum melinis TaxID=328839 RepID=UPI003756785F
MNVAEFLFPRDLEVSPISFSRVLFIGSCLSDVYVRRLREANPSGTYDFILFNNASDLPTRTEAEIGVFDLQYIQLPLRSILTDAVVRIADNDKTNSPIDWLSLGKQNIDLMLDKAMTYNVQAGLLTLISNFVVPQGRISPSISDIDSSNDISWVIRELNVYIAESARKYKNCFVADVDAIASSLGKRYFLDDIIYFYTHGSVFYTDWAAHERTPYWTAPEPGRIEEIPPLGETYENRIDEFFGAVFRQIEAIYRIAKQVDMVKVVIFDLDNTMWRGLLAEHYQPGREWPYTRGWPLGIWEAVHHLRRRGIVTTIASKNDESLVKDKWNDVIDPPFIKFNDFMNPHINWQPKADNIRAILNELSLTPKSAVFVDDNPVERESVKAQLPGIRVIGSDPFTVRRVLLWAPEMQVAHRTQESLNREEMLKKQLERESQKSSMSREEFLTNLGSKVNLWEITGIDHPSFTRASELVNKTNQFNTNGNRWDAETYRQHFSEEGHVFAFSVTDRYAEYGTVGVVFTQRNRIIQFVMSCRVLGMDIEIAVLNHIVSIMREKVGNEQIYASIVNTETNTPSRTVFLRSGFVEMDANNFNLAGDQAGKIAEHVNVFFNKN